MGKGKVINFGKYKHKKMIDDICKITKKEIICPICGLDGFDSDFDLDVHLEVCEE